MPLRIKFVSVWVEGSAFCTAGLSPGHDAPYPKSFVQLSSRRSDKGTTSASRNLDTNLPHPLRVSNTYYYRVLIASSSPPYQASVYLKSW